AVGIVDGDRSKLLRRDAVETRNLDRDEGAADLFDIAVAIRIHAAGFAEAVMAAHRAELVVRGFGWVREQPEIRRLDDGAPGPDLRTVGTVAAARACLEINVRFVAHPPAMTAAAIGLLHGSAPLSCVPKVSADRVRIWQQQRDGAMSLGPAGRRARRTPTTSRVRS